MIRIVVIGTGDADSMMLAERARRCVARCGNPGVKFDYIETGPHDVWNGVSDFPALVMDGRTVCEGSVPKTRDIAAELDRAIAQASAYDLQRPLPREERVPTCGGCGRDCPLDAPQCRVGRERAAQLGVAPRARR